MKPILLTETIKNEQMLDEWLNDHLFSKKQRHLLKMEKRIRVNHQIITHNIHLFKDDLLEINCAKEEQDDLEPIDLDLEILYEDDIVLVINKPIHMIVHEDGNHPITLDQAVAGYFQKTDQTCPIRHIHRLDKDTSGCILYCKQSYLQPYFDHAIKTKQIQRTYLAIVQGKINQAMTIHKSIGKDRHANRFRISSNGIKAITHLKPLTYKKNKTLIECQLETGRTHQIRVHLAGINHPLIGDELYGTASPYRCMLHSYSLSFIHPLTHKKIEIICEMPKDMRLCMES